MSEDAPQEAALPGEAAPEPEAEAHEGDVVAEVSPDDGAELPESGVSAADERYLRLAADFDNFRRRTAQELVDRSRYASEDAAKALIPVLDNLRRAVVHAAEDGPPDLVNGLELTVREFETALDRLGVTVIAAEGQPFDPAVHEAIGADESDGVEVDTVAAEVQRGYRLHDRVLRPALVRVAHPAAPSGRT